MSKIRIIGFIVFFVWLPNTMVRSHPFQNYLEGDSSQFNLHQINWNSASPTRQVIPLNGIWEASRIKNSVCYEVLVPGAFPFQGTVVFSRNFLVHPDFSERHFKLVAYGIHYRCSVFVNDKLVGSHIGGYNSFTLDIQPGIIRPGKMNQIRIIVDNWLDARQTIPLKHNPWGLKNYGGIFRDIYLLVTPPMMIDDFRYHCILKTDSNQCLLQSDVSIRNLDGNSSISKNIEFQISLQNASKNVAQTPAITKRISLEAQNKVIPLDVPIITILAPQLWTPENPQLYLLRLALVNEKTIIDEIILTIGLRTISIQSGQFILNGQSYRLTGINWHEWHPERAILWNYALLEEEIHLMKTLGANCLRIAGPPPHPYLVQLCSEIGILVFEGLPLRYPPATIIATPVILETAQNQLIEIIQRDRTQPAVAGWGLGTGLKVTAPTTQHYLDVVQNLVEQQDLRPTYTVVTNPHFDQIPKQSKIVFLHSYNLLTRPFPQLYSEIFSKSTAKLLAPSLSYPYIRGDFDASFSMKFETNQCYHLCNTIQQLSTRFPPSALFINALSDWPMGQPLTMLGPEDDGYLAPYGLTTRYREPRLAFQHVTANFTNDKLIPTTAENVKREPSTFFTLYGIGLVLLFLYFYKKNRRLRINLSRSFFRPHGFFTDIRENRKMPVFDTFFLGLFTAAAFAGMIACIAYYFRTNFVFDQLLSLFFLKNNYKETIIALIWNPTKATMVFLFIFFGVMNLHVIFTKLFARLLGKQISFFNAIIFNIWVTAGFVVLIPFISIFYRLLSMASLQLPLLGLVGIINGWIIIRFFKGLATVLFAKMRHVVLVSGGIYGLILGSILFYYQKNVALLDYLHYYW